MVTFIRREDKKTFWGGVFIRWGMCLSACGFFCLDPLLTQLCQERPSVLLLSATPLNLQHPLYYIPVMSVNSQQQYAALFQCSISLILERHQICIADCRLCTNFPLRFIKGSYLLAQTLCLFINWKMGRKACTLSTKYKEKAFTGSLLQRAASPYWKPI